MVLPRRTDVILLPRATSSTSLSIQRICCMSGSSISSTRIPQMTPVISVAWGFIRGACAKKVSRSTSSASARSSPASS